MTQASDTKGEELPNKRVRVNAFGEIACSVCGFNEGMPGPNMMHICADCRECIKHTLQN